MNINNQFLYEINRLQDAESRLAERYDKLRSTLTHISAIAHFFDLNGLDTDDALMAIRKLSRPYFLEYEGGGSYSKQVTAAAASRSSQGKLI